MFEMELEIKDVQQFFQRLEHTINDEMDKAVKEMGDKAKKLATVSIVEQNPSLVGISSWDPLSSKYLVSFKKRTSLYPNQLLKLEGRMMKQFYCSRLISSFKSGKASVFVSNASPYFPIMELGGGKVPARPSLLPLAKHTVFINQCIEITLKHIEDAITKAGLGI